MRIPIFAMWFLFYSFARVRTLFIKLIHDSTGECRTCSDKNPDRMLFFLVDTTLLGVIL